ncbi:MAG TPA: M20/M25/M40 family metallo-hydrolase [Natrialbaceae archaeon]|nr:M20/M25/M40 family metallo-hydrolase [Natrialbaceae archaeon]
METRQREFLEELLETPSPSGYETAGQRVWIDYVSEFADEVRTDEYGNAVAVHEGTGDGPEVAVTGHADEIGFIVRTIDDDGFLHIDAIGGSDRTVSRGQHVTIHGDDGPVQGVIGQTAIHLRNGDDEVDDISEQRIDVGAADGEAARDLVSVGDPVTFSSTIEDLLGTRLAARGMDNRVGTWTAAETLRKAVERDVDATVYAVSTVQEELGLRGARMIGFELDPDAVMAVDVTHAADYPHAPGDAGGEVELGGGPVVGRGSANHSVLVDLARESTDAADVEIQLQAAGLRTGTDADAFYTARSGVPSLNVSVPNRYMHTPVEVVDTEDLVAATDLLAEMVDRAGEYESFSVEV